MKILRKDTVSAEFRAIRPKLCGNCAFPQNFHTRKLGKVTAFYAVRALGESPRTPQKLCVSAQSFCSRKLDKITVFYAVTNIKH